MFVPLSEKEVKKQSLILEFYEAFNMDDFGSLLYKRLNNVGLSGGKLVLAPNNRDVILTLYYGTEKNFQKEVVYLNVFDVFGNTRHIHIIRNLLRDYFIKMFGSDYRQVLAEYEKHKAKKNIKEYVEGEELLLQPW